MALGISTLTDGRIVDVNERWLAMFGYARDQVIGRTNAELNITPEPGARDGVMRQLRAGGGLREIEMPARTRTGERIDLIVSAVPFAAEDGEEMLMSAAVDITDRKRMEVERDVLLGREQATRAEAEQALEKLRAVYAITDTVAAQTPLGDLLGELLRRLKRTLQIDHASVFLLDEDRKALYLRAIEGLTASGTVPPVRIPLGVGASGRIAVEGRPMIFNDYSEVDSSGIQGPNRNDIRRVASVMGAPFRIDDFVAGVVMVSSMQRRPFTEEDLRLLSLASDRVGPAIERGRLIEQIRNGIERQKTLSRRLLTAQEEERRRLAVELHDELGQVLTAVKINLESLARGPAVPPTPAVLAPMVRSVDEALQRVKDIALDLRPSVLDDLGLAAALRWFGDRFAQGSGVEAHLSIGELPSVEPGTATACFRVAQEALTNVRRHSRARQVWLDLHVLAGALELSVRDDGIGFDIAAARDRAHAGASVGLLGMQERALLVGGEFEVANVPAGGTVVRARFPLEAGRS